MKKPISLHNYLYADANPIYYTEPSGKFSITEFGTVLALIAVLTIPGDVSPDLPPRPPSNASEYERSVEYAWQAYQKGCYNPNSPDNPSITACNMDFVRIDDSIKKVSEKWPEVDTYHAKESHESPKRIANTGYSLKVYFDDYELGDIMAIVTPTSSIAHYWQGAQWYFLGIRGINLQNAQIMMLNLRKCN